MSQARPQSTALGINVLDARCLWNYLRILFDRIYSCAFLLFALFATSQSSIRSGVLCLRVVFLLRVAPSRRCFASRPSPRKSRQPRREVRGANIHIHLSIGQPHHYHQYSIKDQLA